MAKQTLISEQAQKIKFSLLVFTANAMPTELFAPVNLQQWVHCTSPDGELPLKWPLASHRKHFLVQKN